jgi:hypothetical protein
LGFWKGGTCVLVVFRYFTGALVAPFRWRILKTGIQLHGVPVVTDIWCWKTCCALYNWCVLSCVSDYASFAQRAQKIPAAVHARCGECVTCPWGRLERS